MLRKSSPCGRPLRVCIVGAGVAGMRAASILLKCGVHVTIYEGRDRLGGRVTQNSSLGHVVDLGPNWIHGTVNNPILDLVKATGTVLQSTGEEQAVIDEDGTFLPEQDVVQTSDELWGIISDAFKRSNEQSESLAKDRSLMDYVQDAIDEKYQNQTTATVERRKRLLTREAEMWGSFVGSSTSKQSLKFFWMEECLEGENLFVAGTFSKVLELIAKPVRSVVKFKELVRKISQTDVEKDGERQIAIETGSGVEHFDQVIVTSPLGCLKRGQIQFEPALPMRLQKAIESVGYGTLDKVYITFPSAWWNQAPFSSSPRRASDTRTLPNMTANAVPLHPSSNVNGSGRNGDSTDSHDGSNNHFPGFVHWFKPNYSTKTNPEQWSQQAVNLAALPSSCAHPTLLYYTFGDCSLHIAQLVKSHSSSAKKVQEALNSFFEPYYSLLPNYNPNNEYCKPKALLATAWAGDELAGYGSYSNFQVGLEEGDKDIEAMRHGIPERGIWLAGEHTAPFVALGTMTGAYWSGEKVANRILEMYGLDSKEHHSNGTA